MKTMMKRTAKKVLALTILLLTPFFSSCSPVSSDLPVSSYSPVVVLKNSVKVSKEVISSLTGLSSNPAVIEFYKKYEDQMVVESKKEQGKLKNIRKKLIINSLNNPFISYHLQNLEREEQSEEQEMAKKYLRNISGDAFEDSFKGSFKDSSLAEWAFELKDKYFGGNEDETVEKYNMKSLADFLKTEKIDWGVKPSFKNGEAGGRIFAKAENFRFLTNFKWGRIEVGTGNEEFGLRTRLEKEISKNWDLQIHYKSAGAKDDLSISFIRNNKNEKLRVEEGWKISDYQIRSRFAVFFGHNHDSDNDNNEYVGISFIEEF